MWFEGEYYDPNDIPHPKREKIEDAISSVLEIIFVGFIVISAVCALAGVALGAVFGLAGC